MLETVCDLPKLTPSGDWVELTPQRDWLCLIPSQTIHCGSTQSLTVLKLPDNLAPLIEALHWITHTRLRRDWGEV